MARLIRTVLLITLLFAYQICSLPSYPSTIIDCGDAINDLTEIYLKASHSYLMMAAIIGNQRNDLPELKVFFRKQSDERRETAIKLMDYQNMRDSKIRMGNIESYIPLDMKANLPIYEPYEIENKINKVLHVIYAYALDNKAYAFANYLSGLMEKQILIISKRRNLVSYLYKNSSPNVTCPSALDKFLY